MPPSSPCFSSLARAALVHGGGRRAARSESHPLSLGCLSPMEKRAVSQRAGLARRSAGVPTSTASIAGPG